MTAPNAELAYRVIDHIDAHPEQWVQSTWIGEAECGTVGCFAGWTVMLSGATPEYVYGHRERTCFVDFNEGERMVSVLAEQLLGASRWVEAGDGESDDLDLFDEDNTREDLGRLVAEIFGPRPARAACGRRVEDCRCDTVGAE